MKAPRFMTAPYRWWMRRGRRALALDALRRARHTYGQDADLTVWDGRLRGGVGTVRIEGCGVQMHVDDDGYHIQWFGRSGRNEHPTRHKEVDTTDDATMEATVAQWTARWHIHERRPSAGPHHMEI